MKKPSQVVGSKISIQKSVAFLSTNNELPKKGNKENGPIYNNIKNNKTLNNTLNQAGKRSLL